ncbi:16S rRNA (cytidine(1402)-2'-O)-methyltransferase [Algihabitans albus]|uniref:16S rRNA (cytidine(1402)-2'-O)-methyltransferase n=1 Tax=Algihabitans albus TaxID=2164067 RepID=UPI000E5D7B39|nr:16S rRNA (cytidine(1402)-2'-O)-methyltransferase [Algihabitans albus]
MKGSRSTPAGGTGKGFEAVAVQSEDDTAELATGTKLLRLETPLKPLEPALYLVACPIGNLADVTLRALSTLAQSNLLVCEDTRYTRRLLQAHGLDRPDRSLLAYHEHNAARVRPKLIEALKRGETVALVSDAGTPLVSDPGFKLVRLAVEAGIRVIPIPGPSAVLAGLVAAGLPSDRFCFAGFPPPKSAARQRWLAELKPVPATLILFEAPQRLAASLSDMVEVLGGERPAAVARELTKLFEEVRRAPLAELAATYAAEAQPKGEIVVIVGPPLAEATNAAALDAALRSAFAAGGSLKDAVQAVQAATGLPRKQVYARALALSDPKSSTGSEDGGDANA